MIAIDLRSPINSSGVRRAPRPARLLIVGYKVRAKVTPMAICAAVMRAAKAQRPIGLFIDARTLIFLQAEWAVFQQLFHPTFVRFCRPRHNLVFCQERIERESHT